MYSLDYKELLAKEKDFSETLNDTFFAPVFITEIDWMYQPVVIFSSWESREEPLENIIEIKYESTDILTKILKYFIVSLAEISKVVKAIFILRRAAENKAK